MDYPIVIAPLSEEDGGGFLGMAPDLLGCMSDGETPEEALANTTEAVREWIETAERRGMKVPAPGSAVARQKAARQHLISRLRQLTNSVDEFEARIQELETMAREMEERLENADAWERFAAIAGMDAPNVEKTHRLVC